LTSGPAGCERSCSSVREPSSSCWWRRSPSSPAPSSSPSSECHPRTKRSSRTSWRASPRLLRLRMADLGVTSRPSIPDGGRLGRLPCRPWTRRGRWAQPARAAARPADLWTCQLCLGDVRPCMATTRTSAAARRTMTSPTARAGTTAMSGCTSAPSPHERLHRRRHRHAGVSGRCRARITADRACRCGRLLHQPVGQSGPGA
jgi:hypothetical protein